MRDGANEQGATQGPDDNISNGQPLESAGEDRGSGRPIFPATDHTSSFTLATGLTAPSMTVSSIFSGQGGGIDFIEGCLHDSLPLSGQWLPCARRRQWMTRHTGWLARASCPGPWPEGRCWFPAGACFRSKAGPARG